MSDAVIGGIVTGFFTLAGVLLTHRYLAKRADREREDRRKEAKAARLRSAYREIITAANGLAGHAAALGLAETAARKLGYWEEFTRLLTQSQHDIRDARSALLLEAPDDQIVLDRLMELTTDHITFIASLDVAMDKGEGMAFEEYKQRTEAMRKKAEDIATLARDRISDLGQ